MRIRVRLFAALREAAGSGEVQFDLDAGASVGDVVQRLRTDYPQLAGAPFAVAKNRRYAGEGEPVADGDELALIPPVSGG